MNDYRQGTHVLTDVNISSGSRTMYTQLHTQSQEAEDEQQSVFEQSLDRPAVQHKHYASSRWRQQ